MRIIIKKHSDFNDRVVPKDIHGKYPYKLYLRINEEQMGIIDKYVLILSKEKICNVDEIEIKDEIITDKNKGFFAKYNTQTNNNKIYSVTESSILEVADIPMYVYQLGV